MVISTKLSSQDMSNMHIFSWKMGFCKYNFTIFDFLAA